MILCGILFGIIILLIVKVMNLRDEMELLQQLMDDKTETIMLQDEIIKKYIQDEEN